MYLVLNRDMRCACSIFIIFLLVAPFSSEPESISKILAPESSIENWKRELLKTYPAEKIEELFPQLQTLRLKFHPHGDRLLDVVSMPLLDQHGNSSFIFTILNHERIDSALEIELQTIAESDIETIIAVYRDDSDQKPRNALKRLLNKEQIQRIREISKTSPKLGKVYFLEQVFWKHYALGMGVYEMSLLEHAAKEWAIIRAILSEDETIPLWSLGIPSETNLSRIQRLVKRDFNDVIKNLKGNHFVLEFTRYLLILHDIGKAFEGEKGHEIRGEQMLREIEFKPRGWAPNQSELFLRFVGFNGIDSIHKPQNEKKFKTILIWAKNQGITKSEMLQLLNGLILFRIAEHIQTEHFGIVDEPVILAKRKAFEKAKALIEAVYTESLRVKDHLEKDNLVPETSL